MISDVLWEAEQQIKEYLTWDNNPYGEPGEPFRDRIDKLLVEMESIRMQPGMDLPPLPETPPIVDNNETQETKT